METKVCKDCGRELPIENYKTIFSHGQYRVTSICADCFKQHQKDGHAKRKNTERQNMEAAVNNAKTARLADFTPRELMKELKNRGYEFTMKYVEVHVIDSKNL